MKTFKLEGTIREQLGKKPTKSTRSNDKVPCVLYGGSENIHFDVTNNSVRKLIYTPEIYLIEISVGEKTINAIMKDLQFHPVTDKVLHIDFLEVFENKPVIINVPVKLNGLAEGVKQGGKLIQEMRTIRVKALYNDIPEYVEVDVTNVHLGKTIQVGAVSFPGLEILSPSMNIICVVKLTRAAKGMALDDINAEGDQEAAAEGAEATAADGEAAAEGGEE